MPLVEDPEVRAHLEDWYRQRKRTDIPDSNWRQALVPEGAVVFSNTNGTAPGLALEKKVRPRFFFRDRRTNCIRWWKIRFVLIFRNDLTV